MAYDYTRVGMHPDHYRYFDNQGVGLYEKFRVERVDGRSGSGEKHDGCVYFVLDITHDLFAAPALVAYADACESEYPDLARDLRLMPNRVKEQGSG